MTALMIYTLVASAVVVSLLVMLGVGELRARRRQGRDVVLGNRYLQLVMMSMMTGDQTVPRFPMIGRPGTRQLLAETIAGMLSVTYGLDPEPLRRIVVANELDGWLLRHARRSRGFVQARYLWLLATLPVGEAVVVEARRYLESRNRSVRFQALLVQIAADPSTALRLMSEYTYSFSASEVSQIMTLLRRGLLPIAYEPLVLSPNGNLRKIGLGIIRQFGIEEAEKYLLRIVASDTVSELGREALYALCALKRPLTGRVVASRIAMMNAVDRRALLRYLAREGYSPQTLRRMLDERERPYFESLVQSYKRCLA